ncbi:hypothetical protein [Mesorhizobium metallidurans]|nr:hypothetical protein [Mesorhizobium metallidurans]
MLAFMAFEFSDLDVGPVFVAGRIAQRHQLLGPHLFGILGF